MSLSLFLGGRRSKKAAPPSLDATALSTSWLNAAVRITRPLVYMTEAGPLLPQKRSRFKSR
jgi:hypothetical protein